MSGDIIKKFGDVKRTRYYYETKDKRIIKKEKQIVLKDCYILIKANGDSFVGLADEFKRMGIEIPKDETSTTNTNTSGQNSPQV